MLKKVFLIIIALSSFSGCALLPGRQVFAGDGEVDVLFHAELPSAGEYSLFAGGGWDGNWYVGKNHSWIKKLPPLDIKGYERVYLGARLGRSKTYQQIEDYFKENGESDISPGPYSILIGVSESAEKKPAPFLLTEIEFIPPEGADSIPLPDAGGSRWFWREVPMEEIASDSANYVWIWSEDDELNNRLTSPILAAGIGSDQGEKSFLIDEEGMKNIRYFEPGIAIKFASGSQKGLSVSISDFREHPYRTGNITVLNSVKGRNIVDVRPQIKIEGEWINAGISAILPPYDIALDISSFPPGEYYYRSVVEDWSGPGIQQRAQFFD